jgi:hypothetical protein
MNHQSQQQSSTSTREPEEQKSAPMPSRVVRINDLGSIGGILGAAKMFYDSWTTPADSEVERRARNPRFEVAWGTPCGSFNIGANFEPNEMLVPSNHVARRKKKPVTNASDDTQ